LRSPVATSKPAVEILAKGRLLKKAKGQVKQEMYVHPSRKNPLLKPLRGQGQRVVPLQKWSDLRKCPGTYTEVLTNL
jgi:hypothetical protein